MGFRKVYRKVVDREVGHRFLKIEDLLFLGSPNLKGARTSVRSQDEIRANGGHFEFWLGFQDIYSSHV